MLGFFFQRPESHLIHHQEKVHDYNYSDLPIWDMLFGTFRNPREWDARCGLGEENESRIVEMFLCIDVSKSRLGDRKNSMLQRMADSLSPTWAHGATYFLASEKP